MVLAFELAIAREAPVIGKNKETWLPGYLIMSSGHK